MKQKTNLAAQLAYLNTLQRYEKIKLGLANMQNLMAALGNPQNSFPSAHIAGTNGKGSTAAFLARMLQVLENPTPRITNHESRITRKIGLYTSPYLQNFNERLAINGRPISNQALSSLIHTVRTAAAQANLEPTYFEFATALAFLHFAQQRVDYAVIEVGLGGDLDATNVITPAISIITNIGHDHAEFLGKDSLTVARHKAGIIKTGVPLITAETDPKILNYFAQICRSKNASLHIVQKELPAKIIKQTLAGQTFKTSGAISATFKISLLGEHQVINTCTALLALHVLSPRASQGDLSAGLAEGKMRGVKSALAKTTWPGRLQILSRPRRGSPSGAARDPFILLDGAHNPEGMAALVKFLKTNLCPPPDILVLGIKDDKNAGAMLQGLVPLFRKIIVTEANFQPMPSAQLASRVAKLYAASPNKTVQSIPNLPEALAAARGQLEPGKMLLITGSLYLVGDVLRVLKSKQ